MIIGKTELEQIVNGACFLASGGGGPISLAQSCIDASFKDGDTVEVVDVDSISDDDWIVLSSGMGLPSGDFNPSELNMSVLNVTEVMQDWCSKNKENFENFKYIIPVEVGTINSVLPIIACKLAKDKGIDLKVLNADPAGRSVPTLPLTLFAGHNCDFYPNFMASGAEEPLYASYKMDTLDQVQDYFAQLFTSTAFNNSGGIALYPMSKKDLKPNYYINNTMLDALNIGKIIEQTGSSKKRVNDIVDYMNNVSTEKRKTKKIFTGILQNIEETVVDGTNVGTLIIEGTDEYDGKTLDVTTKNENLFANIIDKDGVSKPYIMGPDSICYLLEEIEDIKILDVTGLDALFNCPIEKTIKLYVVGIDASPKIKVCQPLIANWCEINKSLDGPDTYTQPWLKDEL